MTSRRVGVAAALVGLVAAGTAAGVAVERRAVGRARRAPDPYADEPFGALHGGGRTVYAEDGVPLHVPADVCPHVVRYPKSGRMLPLFLQKPHGERAHPLRALDFSPLELFIP